MNTAIAIQTTKQVLVVFTVCCDQIYQNAGVKHQRPLHFSITPLSLLSLLYLSSITPCSYQFCITPPSLLCHSSITSRSLLCLSSITHHHSSSLLSLSSITHLSLLHHSSISPIRSVSLLHHADITPPSLLYHSP